ncbi:MAG: glycosyltransferase family 2 protein [Anaerolineae bacterium]|nr:glycosyltransferase family 2 protein [Anaerolineae bacterium]
MTETPTVSVIIRAYTEERWDDLVQSVASVQQQNVPVTEIVLVIDNNPTLLARATAQFPGVNVVANRYEPGSSNAWNMGIESAQSEIVAFIDDDAIAEPDWIENLLEPYALPDVEGVGGHIEPHWLGGRPRWFPEEFNWVVGCSYRGLPATLAPVRNLIGCNMSFRRASLIEIGMLLTDKGLGHKSGQPIGCDETEMCIRLGQHKPTARLLHNPQAKVLHSVPAKRATWRYFSARCYLEGKSKAVVSQLVGADQGTSTERSYVLKTLPTGVLRGLRDGIFKLDPYGFMRAGAIIGGLAITTFAYLRMQLASRWQR